jgi:toxin ParE1/3/4
VAEVIFHPDAAAEYQASLMWYRARSPRVAAGFREEVERTLDTIAERPDFYPWYDEDHRYAVLHRYPFSIVYQATANSISIIAVAHASRKADYWQDRV